MDKAPKTNPVAGYLQSLCHVIDNLDWSFCPKLFEITLEIAAPKADENRLVNGDNIASYWNTRNGD